MACELPIVATEISGIPELVQSGDNGLLVAPEDPGQLAGALLQMIEKPEETERIAQRGRERVLTMFESRHCIRECARLLRPYCTAR